VSKATETVPTLSVSDTTPGKNHIFCRLCQGLTIGEPGIGVAHCGGTYPASGIRLKPGEKPENCCETCAELGYCPKCWPDGRVKW
jgi:hypothetical protein